MQETLNTNKVPIFVLITSLKREITNKEFLLSPKDISIEKANTKQKCKPNITVRWIIHYLLISPQSLCQSCSLHNGVRQLLHTKCYQQIQVSTEASPVVKCLYTKPSNPRVQVEPAAKKIQEGSEFNNELAVMIFWRNLICINISIEIFPWKKGIGIHSLLFLGTKWKEKSQAGRLFFSIISIFHKRILFLPFLTKSRWRSAIVH